MKGQMFEIMGFLILAIAVIVVIVMIQVFLVGDYGRTFASLLERHEAEGVKAGINSVLFTTEEKTGKKLSELLGIAAQTQQTKIDFGPVVGTVDVAKEVEWRFDALFGKGKWYMKIPPPETIPYVQLVIILDTSASLCDDIEQIKEHLPKIIENLKEKYNIFATIYMLPGGQECCDGKNFVLDCKNTNFPESSYLHCRDISRLGCSDRSVNEEDWGRGLACAIQGGPEEGWFENATKVGMIFSDELSSGSESKGDERNEESLEIGINAAKKFNMTIFPIKTNTGKECCSSCENCDPICDVCLMWWNQKWVWSKTYVFPTPSCEYDEVLAQHMDRMAKETEGKMYVLNNSLDVADSINTILTTLELKKKVIELGTLKLPDKNIRAVTVQIPVVLIGEYTNVFAYQWS